MHAYFIGIYIQYTNFLGWPKNIYFLMSLRWLYASPMHPPPTPLPPPFLSPHYIYSLLWVV